MKRLSAASRPGASFTIPPLMHVNDSSSQVVHEIVMKQWQPIADAPFERDLEVAVIDRDGPHALIFPCRRTLGGWISAETQGRIEVRPTHWREWTTRLN